MILITSPSGDQSDQKGVPFDLLISFRFYDGYMRVWVPLTESYAYPPTPHASSVLD